MVTLYRIIDTTDNSIVAQGMTYEQAHESLYFYTQDHPDTRFEIEEYLQSGVKPGFGRDPDLH